VSVDHYENFPVASWLCPPAFRAPIRAIYAFARTADDLADEGDASPHRRLSDLAEYRASLLQAAAGKAGSGRWPSVFGALQHAMALHGLPLSLLVDLLDAFEQDVRNPLYANRTELLDYCRRSANPIGRLLLHLYGVRDSASLQRSDAVCSALQLINFWQDLGVDLARGRRYVPVSDALEHGVSASQLAAREDNPSTRALVAGLCSWAADLMHQGAPLANDLPGRIGWELRWVVQGGLRVLEKIARMDHATIRRRPALNALDAPTLAWRAAWMRPLPASAGSAA